MVALVACAAWVLWSSFERSKEAGRSVEHTYHVLIASERFLSTIREMESNVRAYVITRNSNFVNQTGNAVKPLVRVASNTPVGIFFIKSVTDQPQQGQ